MSSKNTVYPSLGGNRQLPKYAPRDTLFDGLKGAAAGGIFGLNVVLIRNSLSASRTMTGGLKGNMGVVAVYSMVGAAYTVGEAVSANLREEETAKNAFAGGAAAGAIVGASLQRGISKSVGGALILGTICAAFDWGFDRGKQSLQGAHTAETKLDEDHPRQGFWELVHRRPLSQTVEQLGDLAKQFVH